VNVVVVDGAALGGGNVKVSRMSESEVAKADVKVADSGF
jgi:hypothetical protein